MRNALLLLLLLAAAGLVPAALAGELTVYTALETDQLPAYEAAIKADLPDVTLKWSPRARSRSAFPSATAPRN